MKSKWKHDAKRRVYQNDFFIISICTFKKFGYTIRLKREYKDYRIPFQIGYRHDNLKDAKKLCDKYTQLLNDANINPPIAIPETIL